MKETAIPQCMGLKRDWIFILSSVVLASTVAQSSETLTLTSCLSKVESSSVIVAQSVVNQARAKAALKEAYRPRLPQLVAQANVGDAYNQLALSNDANKAVMRIEQGTLPLGSAWRLGEQRELEYEVAKLSVIESVQDVKLMVKGIYFSILRDQDLVTEMNLVEQELNKLVSTVAPKFQIGRAPSFDLVKVKSAIYDLARSRDLTRSDLVGLKSQMSAILKLNGIDFELKSLEKIPASELSNAGLEENPTLATLEKSIEASKVGISVTRAQRVPTLSAAFEFGPMGQTPTTTVPSWATFAQLRFPIFDWGLISSQVDQAESSMILAEKKYEAESQRIQSSLDQVAATAKAHLADYRRLEELLPVLKKTAETAVSRYRVGGIGIIETTDAVNLWLSGLSNDRAAYYNYLSDLANIERLVGKSQVIYE